MRELGQPKLNSLMARVLSCIQPTGHVHLGNYLGAIKRWADEQTPESFHGIVDMHALTIQRDPADLRRAVLELAQILLASGLDPNATTLFAQSHVHEHAELGWILQCTTSMGELERMTQFKDKTSKSSGDFISAGLFAYPSLMAADILLYDAAEVPVGDDQRQHLELTRDVAQRFNGRYGETLVVPIATIAKVGARIMDLQEPTNKMSKSTGSEAGTIWILDDPKAIEKKLKRAVTDLDGEVRFDVANKPGVSNLLSILSVASGEPDVNKLATKYTQYGPLKADTAAALIEFLTPLQTKFRELEANPEFVRDVLDKGAAKAQAVASVTLDRVKAAIGLIAR
jgi:tryptophanyl-tRNA synthetase